MKKIYIIATVFVASITIMGFMKFNKPVYFVAFPTNVEGAGEVVDSDRFDTWVNSAARTTDVFVLPADGPNFEGDNPISPATIGVANNLDFHRWAEQMFLWILSPAPADGSYGNCSGLVLNSKEFYDFDENNGVYIRHRCIDSNPDPTSVSKGSKNTVAVFNSMTFGVKGTNKGSKNLPLLVEKETNRVFDVDKTPKSENGYQLVYDAHKNKVEVGDIKTKNNQPVFYDRKGKIIENPSLIYSTNLDEKSTVQQFIFNKTTLTIATIAGAAIFILPSQGQAGTENALMARNRSLVYYNIMVNDVAAVFSTMVNKGVLPNTSKFPTTQAELDVIKAYAVAHNFPLVNTNNCALAMEVKTSWVETINFTSTPPASTAVNPPPYLGDYVTIKAYVPNYVQTSTTAWTVSTTTPKRLATLALVGMHVVGSVKGHPEMIWSTFEHENNAPNVLLFCNDINGNRFTVPSDITTKNWLFCDPTASIATLSNFNISNFFQNIVNNGTSTTYYLTAIDNQHTISPSNTLRFKPFGWNGPANNGAAIDNPEISKEGTHTARLVALKNDVDGKLVAGDVRKKYYQVGATWNSKIRPNGDHVGSIILSNATMETTTQNTFSCFGCHTSEPGQTNRNMPKLTFLSHVIPSAQSLQ